jgi:hypothetical protein
MAIDSRGRGGTLSGVSMKHLSLVTVSSSFSPKLKKNIALTLDSSHSRTQRSSWYDVPLPTTLPHATNDFTTAASDLNNIGISQLTGDWVDYALFKGYATRWWTEIPYLDLGISQ